MRDALSPRELYTNANLYEYVSTYTPMSCAHTYIYIYIYIHAYTRIRDRQWLSAYVCKYVCMYVTLFPLIVQEAFEPS